MKHMELILSRGFMRCLVEAANATDSVDEAIYAVLDGFMRFNPYGLEMGQ